MSSKIFGAEEILTSINKIIEEVAEKRKEKGETIEISIGLKGYDVSRDKRFRSEVTLPYRKREAERILVLGDLAMKDLLEGTEIPFVLYDDYKGKNKADKVKRKQLAKKYQAFISVPNLYKVFEPSIFTGKRKPIYMIKNVSDVKNFYEEVKRKIQLNLKPDLLFGFPIGTTKMAAEEVSQNFAAAMTGLIANLKKGIQNVRFVRLKSTRGKPIKYY